MLRLVLLDSPTIQLLQSQPSDFEASHRATLGEAAAIVADIAAQTAALYERSPRDLPWGGYLAIRQDDGPVVGTCAFKTGPNPAGEIEIAYFTFPAYEGQGVASAMAERLAVIALSHGEGLRVVAHTLPERNASARVLTKCGYEFQGEVIDPDDGPVWRWELRR